MEQLSDWETIDLSDTDTVCKFLQKQSERITELEKENEKYYKEFLKKDETIVINEWRIKRLMKEKEILEKTTSQFKMGDIVNLKTANEIINEQRKTIRELNEEIKDLNDVLDRMEE